MEAALFAGIIPYNNSNPTGKEYPHESNKATNSPTINPYIPVISGIN